MSQTYVFLRLGSSLLANSHVLGKNRFMCGHNIPAGDRTAESSLEGHLAMTATSNLPFEETTQRYCSDGEYLEDPDLQLHRGLTLTYDSPDVSTDRVHLGCLLRPTLSLTFGFLVTSL